MIDNITVKDPELIIIVSDKFSVLGAKLFKLLSEKLLFKVQYYEHSMIKEPPGNQLLAHVPRIAIGNSQSNIETKLSNDLCFCVHSDEISFVKIGYKTALIFDIEDNEKNTQILTSIFIKQHIINFLNNYTNWEPQPENLFDVESDNFSKENINSIKFEEIEFIFIRNMLK